ncbi:MAG: cobyric acid synthase, partial [Methanomassiliicoccaceae archaeon]|nr:cobyric acid synthase [Methanomassiliicoccaceae archaeon]
AKAARIRHPDHNINPILIKPLKNGKTQTIVNGKIFGEYDTDSYYRDFVLAEGVRAVRESVAVLKKRFEYVVMEGAGSPAEINIYDKDIANMRAAEIADADCILVVNMKWGGSFAYALGTVELLPKDDRERVKGIILNNMYGDASSLEKGIKELEMITGIPVLGVIPHISVPLPSEDSLVLNKSDMNDNKVRVCILKLPKMAHFTDIDPLYHENAYIRYTDDPAELRASDIIIIPAANATDSLGWMRSNGLDITIKEMKGKIPIIGICGGYQLMGHSVPDGLGGNVDGLGLFDSSTYLKEGGGKMAAVEGTLASTGDKAEGYEMHRADIDTKETPLFILSKWGGEASSEGSSRHSEKLFGTSVHGLFSEPGFRRYILGMTGKYVPTENSNVSYEKILDDTIDRIADVFASSLDMRTFDDIFMRCRQ